LIHAPIDGRPAMIEPVFIWQTEPTWFNPSAQHERITHSSSACFATCGYQSDTGIPLCPYRVNVRRVGISVLPAVPIAVITCPNEAGMGLPASFWSIGLGSNRST